MKIAATVALGAMAASAPPPGPGTAGPGLELQRLADSLALRRASFDRFSVEGMTLRARIAKDRSQGILDAVASCRAGLRRRDAESLLNRAAASASIREGHCFQLWATDSMLGIDRIRDSALDNSADSQGQRQPNGDVLDPAVRHERAFLGAAGDVVIQEGYFVSRARPQERDSVLRSLDLSLADWSPLLVDERHPAGQRRWIDHPGTSPETDVLVYESDRPNGTLRTDYSFDRGHGERPIGVRMRRGEQTVMTIDFLYDPAEADGLPTASVSIGPEGPAGESVIELSVFLRTRVGSLASMPDCRLPAIRIELERSDDARSTVLRQILPAAIEATTRERRLAVAIAGLLDRWGSADDEFDFDGDGVIGAGDVARANDLL
jgi:hypothetical protein